MIIDKNVPIPKACRKGSGKWVHIVGKMNLGDSIFFRNKKKKQGLYCAIRQKGFKSVCRAEKKGCRVWKMSKKWRQGR